MAAELNRMGYTAFVLHYRVGGKSLWPAPMEDLQQAIHTILDHADEFNVEKDNYAVAGFSAGGHMTASLGTHNYGFKKWNLPKPGLFILGYPVTTFDQLTRKLPQQPIEILFNKNPAREQIDSLNTVLHMDKDTPPTFLVHSQDDDAAYYVNSEMQAKKLKELNIPYKFKTVPTGGHGFGLGNGTPAQGWLAEAVQFWQATSKG